MDTATISVLASSVVALAAIGTTWLQHRSGLRHERTLADLDGLREVLDEAAVALHRIAYALDDLRSQLTQHRPTSFLQSEEGTKLYKLLGEHGEVLDGLLERVSVRLGRTNDVSKALSAADSAVLKIYRAAGLLRLEDAGDGSDAARYAIERIEGEQREQIGLNRERFNQAREWYVAAAQRLAGARIDG